MSNTAKILQHPAAVRRAFSSAGLNPALTAWITAAVPPDVDIYAGLRQLRARSRECAQNDDHMAYFLRLVETNIIGRQGVTVQAHPRLPSGAEDKTLAARLEAAYAVQSERGHWDATGQLSRHAFDRLGVRTVAQDGEALIRIHEPDPESPTGFSVELIDAEALDLDYNDTLRNGHSVRMGVEMTQRRRPVAYWLFRESSQPFTGYRSGYGAAERVRIPVEEIIHVYLPEWAWGTRGVPWAKTSLRRLKMLGGYEEAAITAARAAAVKSAAYVAKDFATPETAPNGQRLEDGTFVQDLTPGGIEQVPYGWDLQTLDWSWPNVEHGEFVKEALRSIASGLGVSYNALANDLEGVNFSSLRQGALTERDLWMGLQEWWIDWVSRPLYRRWAAFALRSGRVSKNNGNAYPLDRLAALSHATYQARRWPWVDPTKDIRAAKEAIGLGVRSISDVIRESGRDPEEVWVELADDYRRMEQAGVPRPNLNPLAATTVAPPAEPDPEDAP